MKTVFILAAGSGTRWNNYRGSPKHRLLIEGEILIERTYRQFSKYADKVIIVANEEQGFAQTYIPPENKSWRDIAKFYSSRDIWTEGKNILVFADVYFTDEAVERIMMDPYGLSFYLRSRAFIRGVRNVFCKESGFKPPTIKPLNHQTIKPYMPHILDYIPETMVCQA
jgi:choline kinase